MLCEIRSSIYDVATWRLIYLRFPFFLVAPFLFARSFAFVVLIKVSLYVKGCLERGAFN